MLKVTLVALLAIAISPALAQLADGDTTCNVDSDCSSRWCSVPPLGPGGVQCLPRPAIIGASCDKNLEATDCDSGFCDGGVCARKADGQPCFQDNDCQNSICDMNTDGNFVCLENPLPLARGCSVTRQCDAGLECPDKFKQCRPIGENWGGGDPKGNGEDCEQDADCQTGICDDHIANDGFNKVCLLGPNLNDGEDCDVHRQCSSGYCVPFDSNTQTPYKCEIKPDDVVIVDPPVTNPSDPPVRQEPVITTIVTVENGQTRTVVATRTTTIRASNTASRGASASAARATGGAEKGVSADSWSVFFGALAVLVGGAAL